ncbi:hypothetical protein [Burkholderia stabilis]|uniref:hypothetical protein n=1 Tax=Burkholderia stabilis TaxID=95485 RepID=UPI001F4B9935|nr:hypothetical protein [Burkholderia stabilis]
MAVFKARVALLTGALLPISAGAQFTACSDVRILPDAEGGVPARHAHHARHP